MRFKDFIKLTPEQKTALKKELSDKQLTPNLEPGLRASPVSNSSIDSIREPVAK